MLSKKSFIVLLKTQMTFLPFVLLDDFAFKRGQSYGTLFCNAITGLPVDLIPSRKQEEVTNWLKHYPFIQLVSRDGSTTYRKAIKAANPTIIQLMDRFHLVQLLYAAQLKALKRLLPSRWIEGSESPKESSLLSKEDNIIMPAKQPVGDGLNDQDRQVLHLHPRQTGR